MKKPKWIKSEQWGARAVNSRRVSGHAAKRFLMQRWFWRVGTIVGAVLLWAASTTLLPVLSATGTTHRVMSTPENVIWGELFKPDSKPILQVKSGDRLVMQTVSHEGILADQGDTTAFSTKAGITQEKILSDQLNVKAKVEKTGPGPHVITGPVYVDGAEPRDVLEIKTLKIDYRAPYGVISNRHSKGSLPGDAPHH